MIVLAGRRVSLLQLRRHLCRRWKVAASSERHETTSFDRPVEELYKVLLPQEHVLKRPDMYIGSTRKASLRTWVVEDPKDASKQRFCDVEIIPGFLKIFDEMLVNVADNYHRTHGSSRRTTRLTVNIDEESGYIEIHNNGRCVDVEWHNDLHAWCPELVFGNFQAGSNFDDTVMRVTGGRNGIGAKATNALSEVFTVEIGDSCRQRRYLQTWSDSMSVKSEPEISDGYEGDEYTCVRFKPLYKYFKLDCLDNDHKRLFCRRVADIAACCEQLEVVLNGQRVPIRGFEAYVHSKYQGEGEEEQVVATDEKGSVQSNEEAKTAGIECHGGHEVHFTKVWMEVQEPASNLQFSLPWEIAVGTRRCGNLSFVNSVNTVQGGTHLDAVANQVVQAVQDSINQQHGFRVHRTVIKDNLSIFVNCLVRNPEFDGQTKERLTYPSVKDLEDSIRLPTTFLEQLCSSEKIVGPIVSAWRARCAVEAAKAAQKRAMKVTLEKLEDAHLAGGPASRECTLILTEGDSAKSLAVAGLSVVGRDKWGVLPLGGKVMNVSKQTLKRIEQNQMLGKVAKAVGLDRNKQYTTEEELSTLRYGSIAIMCDQDPDGSHIKGLILNWLSTTWPKLLENMMKVFVTDKQHTVDGRFSPPKDAKEAPFLKQVATPLVKAKPRKSKKEKEQWFYSPTEFQTWHEEQKQAETLKNWRVKYYKGLGTSTSEEGKEYFRRLNDGVRPLLVNFKPLRSADKAKLTLAFDGGKDRAGDRRSWLKSKNVDAVLDTSLGEVTAEDFVDTELAAYFQHSNKRALPSVIDGLKPSQRKVLFTCLQKDVREEIKVAQLGGAVAERTAYHHGEQSLHDTIIKLSQDFVGCGNNVPLLEGIGQFGTRLGGGTDHASPRYISTKLHYLTRYLFHPEDDDLLELREDEGKSIEPTFYVPILPVILLNGASGIGTGYSTNIPSYDPLAVTAYIYRLLDEPAFRRKQKRRGQDLRILNEDARNKSEILVQRRQQWKDKKNLDAEKAAIYKEVVLAKKALQRYFDYEVRLVPWYQGHGTCSSSGNEFVSEGKMEEGDLDETIRVTELPIGEWTDTFKAKLDSMITSKVIKNYTSKCSDTVVDFTVEMQSSEYKQAEALQQIRKKMKKSIGSSNIQAFLPDDVTIKHFLTAEEVIEGFFAVRLQLYSKRRENKIRCLESDLQKQRNFVSFADVFIRGRVQITDDKEKVIKVMEEEGVEEATHLLARTSCGSLTKDNLEQKRQKVKKLESELKGLEKMDAKAFWKADLSSFVAAYCDHFCLDAQHVRERVRSIASDKTLDYLLNSAYDTYTTNAADDEDEELFDEE